MWNMELQDCPSRKTVKKLAKTVRINFYRTLESSQKLTIGLPWWRSGWESACQCRGHGFEPWSGKIPHAAEQLDPRATTTEPAHLEPVLPTREATIVRGPRTAMKSGPRLPQLEKALAQKRRPNTAKNKLKKKKKLTIAKEKFNGDRNCFTMVRESCGILHHPSTFPHSPECQKPWKKQSEHLVHIASTTGAINILLLKKDCGFRIQPGWQLPWWWAQRLTLVFPGLEHSQGWAAFSEST